MKIIVAIVFAAMILAPSSAFGWKSIASMYEKECIVDCNYDHMSIDNASPINFILLASASLVVLGMIMKSKRLGKYETFSITCEKCGRCTRGLKCVMCEAQKQKA